jgi:hypothetical protein
MEGTTNLPILYFSWWYGYAYARLFQYLRALFIVDFDMFSVKACLTTLFSPWKRDSMGYDGLTLQQKFQVWTLNIASRFIGFVIKTMTLFTYLVSVFVVVAIAIISIVLWPLIPPLAVIIIIVGLRNL